MKLSDRNQRSHHWCCFTSTNWVWDLRHFRDSACCLRGLLCDFKPNAPTVENVERRPGRIICIVDILLTCLSVVSHLITSHHVGPVFISCPVNHDITFLNWQSFTLRTPVFCIYISWDWYLNNCITIVIFCMNICLPLAFSYTMCESEALLECILSVNQWDL